MIELIKALVEIVTPCGIVSMLLAVFLVAALFVAYKLYKQLMVEQQKFYETRDIQETALRENINRLAVIISKQRDVIAKATEDMSKATCPFRLNPKKEHEQEDR